jgi:hypothetical protein
MGGMIEIKRYRKPDGFVSRYWGIYVDGELLAVVLYRKGARAIVDLIQRERARKGAGNAA